MACGTLGRRSCASERGSLRDEGVTCLVDEIGGLAEEPVIAVGADVPFVVVLEGLDDFAEVLLPEAVVVDAIGLGLTL